MRRICFILSAFLVACAHVPTDVGSRPPRTEKAARNVVSSSQYLPMRDGVKIAADVWLPADLKPDERIPTIFHQTRYFRSIRLRWLPRLLEGDPYDHTPLHRAARKDFVSHGYAWVDIDVRGSGASFGTQVCPFSPDEIRDGGEVVRWIVSQPWSNGKVGALGVSYDGSATDFLLVNRDPAVVATAPLFASFDAYTDIAFPGGVRLSWFTKTWGKMNAALDENRIDKVAGGMTGLMVEGVHPVDGTDERTLTEAIHEHKANYDVDKGAQEIVFRDDLSSQDDFHRDGRVRGLAGHPRNESGTIGVFSAHTYLDDLNASNAAVLNYGGWFDGAYAHAAIKRYMNVRNPGSRLVLGPWNHGGSFTYSPADGSAESSFDHVGELRSFFDGPLLGNGSSLDLASLCTAVRYFTMVESKWKTASSWPPQAAAQTLYLAENGSLKKRAPIDKDGVDSFRVDYTADTGKHSRWNTQVGGGPVMYPDRKEQDRKLLVYQTDSLLFDEEVTGHPSITLFVSSTATDGDFFAYLEDIGPDGTVSYVTEGMLRALHRKLSSETTPYADVTPYRSFERKDGHPLVPGEVTQLIFDFQPTSYLFRKSHSIRVAIAGADIGHFAPSVKDPPVISVQRSVNYPSAITLPIVQPGTGTADPCPKADSTH